jgi:hypothetical protein
MFLYMVIFPANLVPNWNYQPQLLFYGTFIIYVVDIHMGVDLFFVFPLKANWALQYKWFLSKYL